MGRTSPSLSGAECKPWADISFVRADDPTRYVDVSFIRHWSYGSNNRKVYFTVKQETPDIPTAISLVNSVFNNVGNITHPLDILIRNGEFQGTPPDYNPSSFNAFTFVYGQGKCSQ